MTWILRLFGIVDATADRVQAAGERIALAAEGMADDWETMRREHAARLGTVPPAVIEDRTAPDAEPARTNGRRRAVPS